MAEVVDEGLKARVARFWDERPCGGFASEELPGQRDFFEQVESYRYATQPFMNDLIGFKRFVDQRVLEIGSGLGTDLRQFALAGARVVGLDLSFQSIALARRHFLAFGNKGAFLQSDAESLPFADGLFDVVYSFGVLHHTPNIQGAIDECYRVLRPGGYLIVMLYNSHSWQVIVEPYLVAVKRWLLRQPIPKHFSDPAEVVRRYDGAENPLGKAYFPVKVRQMLQSFRDIRLQVCHPRSVSGSWVVQSYSRFLQWSRINRHWGFWIVAQARRPAG